MGQSRRNGKDRMINPPQRQRWEEPLQTVTLNVDRKPSSNRDDPAPRSTRTQPPKSAGRTKPKTMGETAHSSAETHINSAPCSMPTVPFRTGSKLVRSSPPPPPCLRLRISGAYCKVIRPGGTARTAASTVK